MGKIAWISGGSRGLGRAMVSGLIDRGWTISSCARSAGRLEEMSSQFGAPHHFFRADVADDRQAGEWVQAALEATGAPDLLINNAAIINHPAPLWEVPAGEFSQLIDVNIKGVFHCIRHALPAMAKRGSGVIVNLSSGWGRSTSPTVAPYCASKYAIEGLSSALASELPAGLACVALSPGVIDTEMLRRVWAEAAGSSQSVSEWRKRAIPFLESLGAGDNGASISVP